MKVFRHLESKKLYYIAQRGWGKTITPPPHWNWYYAYPYETNKKAPIIEIGKEVDLTGFKLEFEI